MDLQQLFAERQAASRPAEWHRVPPPGLCAMGPVLGRVRLRQPRRFVWDCSRGLVQDSALAWRGPAGADAILACRPPSRPCPRQADWACARCRPGKPAAQAASAPEAPKYRAGAGCWWRK